MHRGHDLRDDHPVAIKLFHPGTTVDDERRQHGETDTLGGLRNPGLRHPGLVRLRGSGIDHERRPFVVSDLVEGPRWPSGSPWRR